METIFPVLPTPLAAMYKSSYHSCNNDRAIIIISVLDKKNSLYDFI